MNTRNWSKNIGNWGRFLFRIRGFTPYPIVIIFLLYAQPTVCSFLAGFTLMAAGEMLRLWSVAYTGRETRNLEMGATRLITCGPYARTRNPLYVGNMLMYSGATLIANIWMPYFLIFVWIYFGMQYYFIVLEEERTLAELFGDHYARYRKQVPRYLPRLVSQQTQKRVEPDVKSALVSEKSTFLSFLAVVILLYMKLIY